ncbi:hypothetical protein VTI74DRAFT_9281 [Chaetomium olivicolor]
MVTTRRGRALYKDDPGSRDTDKPATQRPSNKSPASDSTPAKRKLGARPTTDPRPKKRSRQISDTLESIEVRTEDEDVDAVLDATSAQFKPRTTRIEIRLPTSRRRLGYKDATTAKPPSEPSTTKTRGLRLRAERLGRRINSLEVIGDFPTSQAPAGKLANNAPEIIAESAAEEEMEEVPNGARFLDQFQGSPELQSSAQRRRAPRPASDLYDIPEDSDPEHPSPSAARGPATTRPAPAGEEEQPQRAIPAEQHHVTHRPTPPEYAQRSAPVESDEGEETDEDEESMEPDPTELEADEREMVAPQVPQYSRVQNFQIVSRPPPNTTQGLIPVFSPHLSDMLGMMGKEGWTDRGDRWAVDLVNSIASGFQGLSLTAGKYRLASFKLLNEELEDIPNALDLVKQSKYLTAKGKGLEKAFASADKRVSELENLARQQDARLHKELLGDIFACVAPMLVLLLRNSFAVGVAAPDAESNLFLPREGTFTPTTIQHLAQISAWINRLLKPIMPKQTAPEGGDTGKKNRDKFWVMFLKWKEQVKLAIDGYNAQVDRQRDIFEKKQRDIAIREAKRKAEDEERARAAQQDEAWRRSIANIISRPHPNVEKWLKATAGWAPALSSVNNNQFVTAAGTPRSSSASWPAHRLPQSRTVSAGTLRSSAQAPRVPPPPSPHPPPPPQMDYPVWDEEDVEWFLKELNRPNRRPGDLEECAETLERTLEEVKAEKERLKRVGRYRSPVRR